ncbi:hypothetical protein D9M68_527800 [compost metagenome]
MAQCGRQHQPVAPVGHDFQPFGAHIAGDDADVDHSFLHRTHDVRAEPLLHVDGHVGIVDEVGAQHRGQELAHRRGVRENAHMALHAGHVFLQIAAELLQLADHAARVGEQGLAGAGDLHALAAAAQQLDADILFQVLDAGTGRGQRQVGTLRAAGQALGLRNMREQFQVDQIKAHYIVP